MASLVFFFVLAFDIVVHEFLIITPGAKAIAMGSAFTALADDATCAYYNPGALAFVDRASISSMNSAFPLGLGRGALKGLLKIGNVSRDIPEIVEPPWFPDWDRRYTYLGTGIPVTARDVVGVGYTYYFSSPRWVVDPYDPTVVRQTDYDHAVTLSYGRELWRGFGLGASAKYIHSVGCFVCSSLTTGEETQRNSGYRRNIAVDIGFLYRTPIPGLSVGACYQNFDKNDFQGKNDDTTYSLSLPKMERRGIAFQPMAIFDSMGVQFKGMKLSNYIRCAFTCDLVNDLIGTTGMSHDMSYCRGNEVTFLNVFSYRWGYVEDMEKNRVGWTEGYGLDLGLFQFEVARNPESYKFPTSNWRVQVNLTSCDTSEFRHIRSNRELNITATVFSSLILPGAGQFYNGHDLKGLLFLSAAFCLAEANYRNEGVLPKIGLGALYLGSFVDAVWELAREEKTE